MNMMALPFVRTVHDQALVGSSSDMARDLVLAGDCELPLLVRARRQTNGRGRGANAWWSDAGSLTFTLAIDPREHASRPEHEPRLALTAAVAIVESVEPYLSKTIRLGIRWPNDVEVDGRKLAGILPERVEKDDGPRLLIGVGINVTTRLDDAPADVRRMAVSLHELSDRVELDHILVRLLERFGERLSMLVLGDPRLAALWADLDLLLGERVEVELGTRIISGVGRGIDAEGALNVESPNGPERLFGGSVSRTPPTGRVVGSPGRRHRL